MNSNEHNWYKFNFDIAILHKFDGDERKIKLARYILARDLTLEDAKKSYRAGMMLKERIAIFTKRVDEMSDETVLDNMTKRGFSWKRLLTTDVWVKSQGHSSGLQSITTA